MNYKHLLRLIGRAVAHGKSTEWVEGYNTMLKKAIEVIEKY